MRVAVITAEGPALEVLSRKLPAIRALLPEGMALELRDANGRPLPDAAGLRRMLQAWRAELEA